MSFPAILIPDHLEVALVRSTSRLLGNTSRLIRLNGDWQADDFQMRGAGGKAQINDMGLLTQIGIEKSILLTGDITASTDNHKKSNSIRLDTAVIRALGANIVNAMPLIAAIRELPSFYSENLPLDLQNKFGTILKSISAILNLNALTVLPSGEASISELINKEFENLLEIIGDNLSGFMQSFPTLLLPLLEVITPAIERYASVQNLQVFEALTVKIENIIEAVNSLELTNDNNSALLGMELATIESSELSESETKEVAGITEEKSEPSEAEVDGERDDVEIELANENDAEPLMVTEEPIINSEMIELENAEPEQASALDLEPPDKISQHNIALGAILSMNPNVNPPSKDISPSLQIPIDTKEIESTAPSLRQEIVNALNSAPFSMPVKFEALNNNNSIPLRSSTNAPAQTIITDRPQARFAFSQQSIIPSVNRVSTPPIVPINMPSRLQAMMPIASIGVIAATRVSAPNPIVVKTAPVIENTARVIKNNPESKPVSLLTPIRTPVPVALPNQPKIQAQQLPQLKPKPQGQAPAIPVKPPPPVQKPITPERIKAFVQNLPEKLKESAVLIGRIMDPRGLQLPPNFKPIAANNNTPLRPSILNDDNIKTLKERIKINFERVADSVTETIKQKAKKLHDRLKNNPAVGAVCAISGGICRCSKRFNKAAKGILDKATRDFLKENNITEQEYIGETKSQKRLGEILDLFKKPEQNEQQAKENDLLRRLFSEGNKPDTFQDDNKRKVFDDIIRGAGDATKQKEAEHSATAGMTAKQKREAKAKAEQATNQSTPQFK